MAIFNEEQKEWIRNQLQTKAPFEVLEEIKNQLHVNITAAQFKSWRGRNKIFGKIRKNPKTGLSTVFTPEEQKFIEDHKSDYEHKEMAKKLQELYGSTATAKQIHNYKSNHRLGGNLTGGFSQTRPNPHKGQKGWCVKNSEKTRFKKGEPSRPVEPVLTIKWRPKTKFFYIKTAEPNIWEPYHRWLWEKNNGPLQKGESLKFLDNDTTNCTLDNLFICTKGEIKSLANKGLTAQHDPEITKTGIAIIRLTNRIREHKRQNQNNGKDN